MNSTNFYAQDAQGNILPGADVFVYLAGTTTLATGLQTALGAALANPFKASATGQIQFKAPDGNYDIRVRSGPRESTVRGVQIVDTILKFANLAGPGGAATVGYEDGTVAEKLDEIVSGAVTEPFVDAKVAEHNSDPAAHPELSAFITAEADRAEAAQAVVQSYAGIKDDIAQGLATTTSGQYFTVAVPNSTVLLAYYRNTGGAAVLIGYAVSEQGIKALGIQDQDSSVSGLIFAVTDSKGNLTWMQVGLDGKPTPYTAAQMWQAIPQDISDLNDEIFAIVDSRNTLSFLAYGKDGAPTARAAKLIAKTLPAGSAATYKVRPESASAYSIVSGPDIYWPGDSLTQIGAPAPPQVTASVLSAAGYVVTVRNGGVGGEDSVTITARTGANPFIMLPQGGTIPASGSVVVDMLPINGVVPKPLKQGSGGDPGLAGSLAGVPGTITYALVGGVDTYTFNRATPGSSVVVDRPSPYRPYFSNARRGDIYVIFMGQNGPSIDRAIQDTKAIIQHMTALNKRFIVISKPTGTDADDAKYFAEFGRRFISIRQYMVAYGLQDAGITPTAQDNIDIAAGVVPASLRVDSVHWNQAGSTICGTQVAKRLIELEWV